MSGSTSARWTREERRWSRGNSTVSPSLRTILTASGPHPGYREQPEAYRDLCGASLDEARELLLANREEYEAAAGVDAFEVALQSLRVAFQFHLLVTGEQQRDESMAENTEWISRRIGPEGRMILWAHNFHVSTEPGVQGSYLRETFGGRHGHRGLQP